jgi:heme-degrading monooxygenase HmoA
MRASLLDIHCMTSNAPHCGTTVEGRPARVAVIANCIVGPPELGGWAVEMFRPFVAMLCNLRGFRDFRLLELVPHGAERVHLSTSTWDDRTAFEQWRASADFLAPHALARSDRERFGKLRALRFDPVVDDGASHDDVDELILEQLEAAGDRSDWRS